MDRTVAQVDRELTAATNGRFIARLDLRKPNRTKAEMDSLMVRIRLLNERIETLLDERSQLRLLEDVSSL